MIEKQSVPSTGFGWELKVEFLGDLRNDPELALQLSPSWTCIVEESSEKRKESMVWRNEQSRVEEAGHGRAVFWEAHVMMDELCNFFSKF
jgi:hypothetical protein